MSHPYRNSYFFKMIIVLACLGLIVQACGKGKLTVANPNASRLANQNGPATPDAPVPVAQTSNTALTPAQKEVDTNIAKDQLKITLTSVTKSVDATDGSINVAAKINIAGNATEDISIPVKNPVPATGSPSLSVVNGTVNVTKLAYNVSYKGYVDFQDPQNYYLIVTLASTGQTATTQEFAVVVGADDAVKNGVLVLDMPGKGSLDSKQDGFYTYLSTNGPTKPQVLAIASVPFEPAKEIKFTLGQDNFDITASGTLTAVTKDNKLTATVDLLVNGVKTTITDTDHNVDPAASPADFKNATIDLLPATTSYNLSVQGNIDPKNPTEYILLVNLQKKGADLTKPENSRVFAVVFGSGNDQLKNQTVLLLNNPLGSASSNDSLINIMKLKFPVKPAAPVQAPVSTPAPAPTPDPVQSPAPASAPAPAPVSQELPGVTK